MVKFMKARPDSKLPVRKTKGAAAFDIFAHGDYDLRPGAIMNIPAGFHCEFPDFLCGEIMPRSGTAKLGIDRLAGLVDSDYRGEVQVSLINLGSELFEIRNGDRIAQIKFSPVITDAVEVDELTPTERGNGGFGSTGVR